MIAALRLGAALGLLGSLSACQAPEPPSTPAPTVATIAVALGSQRHEVAVASIRCAPKDDRLVVRALSPETLTTRVGVATQPVVLWATLPLKLGADELHFGPEGRWRAGASVPRVEGQPGPVQIVLLETAPKPFACRASRPDDGRRVRIICNDAQVVPWRGPQVPEGSFKAELPCSSSS